jgi:hypothetical protein
MVTSSSWYQKTSLPTVLLLSPQVSTKTLHA